MFGLTTKLHTRDIYLQVYKCRKRLQVGVLHDYLHVKVFLNDHVSDIRSRQLNKPSRYTVLQCLQVEH